ncbi:MAG: hypothetical protein PHF00_06895 [Elusimicrobia bacterium]|nr:hypothetical protein [Elusimicrobiota bacterium]
MRRDIVLRLRIGRRGLAILLAVFLLPGVWEAMSETLTMTTYYPSPAGFYKTLTTTARTILARGAGGAVGIGTTDPGSAKLAVMGGGVGIGTNSPSAQLDVRGTVKVSGALAADGQIAGADVLAAGRSVVAEIACGAGLDCKKTGNSVTINLLDPGCRSDGTCNAPEPKCGATAVGTDNCGNACQLTGPACRYQCGSCLAEWALNACIYGAAGANPWRCAQGHGGARSHIFGGSGTCSTPTSTYTYSYTTCDPEYFSSSPSCVSKNYSVSCTAANTLIK